MCQRTLHSTGADSVRGSHIDSVEANARTKHCGKKGRFSVHRPLIKVLMFALLLLASTALAGTSLKLGAVFPGWDQIRSGGLYDSASDIARSYSRQVAHVCIRPEVFIREQSMSIMSAKLFYEPFLPFNSSERVLHEDREVRVAMISSRTRVSDVMSIMIATRSGVVLILC